MKYTPASHTEESIAIIGIACRFPGATNYEEFWQNLQEGRSSIQEVPKSRWDWQQYWGNPFTEKNKTSCKWGGFIKDVDCFDANFFNISGKEVASMDPQQRIMLELTWQCLEDAGTRPSQLAGSATGVFFSEFNLDYRELLEQASYIEAHHMQGTSACVIPNRVSHFFNFNGPSISIDTACSGSLQALHLAAQSIQVGECDLALAGGVGLMLTPSRFVALSKAGMISPTGSCKSFDNSADGYARSEGAGLVLLKPLKKALEDGDTIYGVLKGSAANHGGKTHTLTYPNPDAQAAVITRAMKRAGISPETINYIEAHGTGTPKGDPVEITGLLKAFTSSFETEKLELPKAYCGIGSSKANIGHMEPTAGIAGVIKVLLALRHRQLPGLVHFKQLNHLISLKDSPFYIVEKLQAWNPLKNQNGETLPRRAGVSSFGFGGTNAHVILEEAPPVSISSDSSMPAYLICLSAKTEAALQRKVQDLVGWLSAAEKETKLIDVSKTLLLGREHFDIRIAFVVNNSAMLLDILQKKTALNPGKKTIISPMQFDQGTRILQSINDQQEIAYGTYSNYLTELAQLYMAGFDGDWSKLYAAGIGQRIGMPVYPFEKTRYWIPEEKRLEPVQLHPLVHLDTSIGTQPHYTSHFTGEENFLKDHVIREQRILPGVAYLEMVCMALRYVYTPALDKKSLLHLKNVVWLSPFVVDEQQVKVQTELSPLPNGQTAFTIYNQDNSGTRIVHSQGIGRITVAEEAPVHDLDNLQNLPLLQLSRGGCYSAFLNAGFAYGPSHQGIEKLFIGQDIILAKLSLPGAMVNGEFGKYLLHPGMMDAAFQATMGWSLIDFFRNGKPDLMLPFTLHELEVYSRCSQTMWAVVHYSIGSTFDSKNQKFDIDLCDETGTVCVRMKGYSGRMFKSRPVESNFTQSPSGIDDMRLLASWEESTTPPNPALIYDRHIVIGCGKSPSSWYLESGIEGMEFKTLQSDELDLEKIFTDYGLQVLEIIQTLLKTKPPKNVLLQLIVFDQDGSRLLSGLNGLLKTASQEYSKLYTQLIECVPDATEISLLEMLHENMPYPNDQHIRYNGNKRLVKCWREQKNTEKKPLPWKPNGVYLITGGMGGLGIIFTNEIISQATNVTLILTGRSTLSDDQQTYLDQLRNLGAQVVYKQAAIHNEAAVIELFHWIMRTYGQLNGILHSAGVLRDSYIINKTSEELRQVLDPKVAGLLFLDKASRTMDLDFFVLFSSISSVLGSAGQADYSLANAFMDEYAQFRNSMVREGKRKGKTLSINWPLWEKGGMHIDSASEKYMWLHRGLVPMPTHKGIHAFYLLLNEEADQVMVVYGDSEKLRSQLVQVDALSFQSPTVVEDKPIAESDQQNKGQLESLLTQLVGYAAEILQKPVEQIDASGQLDEYGFDSILFTQFANKLNVTFGLQLSPGIFFEYSSLDALVDHLLTEKVLPVQEPTSTNNKAQLQAHYQGS